MATMHGLKYLVIAENPLSEEIRIKKFPSRRLAKRYGDAEYGEKWDWRWSIIPVAKSKPRELLWPAPASVGPLRPPKPVAYNPRLRP